MPGRWSARGTAFGAAVFAALLCAGLLAHARLDDHDPAAAARATCRDPVHETSAQLDLWLDGGYRVEQDMWNNTVGTQTMHACSFDRWYVTATQPDTPSVKAYPDVNLNLHGARLDSFSTITSRFGSSGPGTGVYEYAYDVWLNGVATRHSTEVMVWTDTHGNALHVPRLGTFTSRGRTYAVYRAGRFIAYVDQENTSSGELDLMSFFDHAIARGWMPASARIYRIEYGVEICSTGGVPTDFAVTGFSVRTR